MGESHHPIEMMGEYTSGGRLHMAYSFEMLGPDFSAAHFRGKIEEFFAGASGGWPCWAFSNHDVNRHVTRWLAHGASPQALAKQAAALLLSMQGSICLYQGEELGQTETELAFEELTDPAGINFWPEEKGRDGCRTPMVWESGEPNAGFSSADRTWLPVRPDQAAVAVDTQGDGSALEFYRNMLALRKGSRDMLEGDTRFIDLPEPLLAFWRGRKTFCIFNLSPNHQRVRWPGGEIVLSQACTATPGHIKLGPNGLAIILGTPGPS